MSDKVIEESFPDESEVNKKLQSNVSSNKYSLSFTLVSNYIPKVCPYAYYAFHKHYPDVNNSKFIEKKLTSPPEEGCIYETIEIITLYLFLTNFNFDGRAFNRVIQNILFCNDTGIPNANPEYSRKLIAAVQEVRRQSNISFARAIENVFQEVSSLNASTHFLNELLTPEPDQDVHPIPAPPPALGEYALGRYEMDISSFERNEFLNQYPPVHPREWDGYAYSTSAAPFETEILYNIDMAQIQRIMNLLDLWYPERQSSDDSDDSISSVPPEIMGSIHLHETGEHLANLMRDLLRQDPTSYLYIIVSHRGCPMAILQGRVDEIEHEAEVMFSLSNPQNIVDPPHAGTIRGSAQAALHTFILQCINDGVVTIYADAVTNPSARVKAKFGFKFTN